MWGFEIGLSTGQQVQGIVFEDGQVYAHEPIADTYGSIDDLMAAQPGSSFVAVGLNLSLELASAQLIEARIRRLEHESNYPGRLS